MSVIEIDREIKVEVESDSASYQILSGLGVSFSEAIADTALLRVHSVQEIHPVPDSAVRVRSGQKGFLRFRNKTHSFICSDNWLLTLSKDASEVSLQYLERTDEVCFMTALALHVLAIENCHRREMYWVPGYIADRNHKRCLLMGSYSLGFGDFCQMLRDGGWKIEPSNIFLTNGVLRALPSMVRFYEQGSGWQGSTQLDESEAMDPENLTVYYSRLHYGHRSALKLATSFEFSHWIAKLYHQPFGGLFSNIIDIGKRISEVRFQKRFFLDLPVGGGKSLPEGFED